MSIFSLPPIHLENLLTIKPIFIEKDEPVTSQTVVSFSLDNHLRGLKSQIESVPSQWDLYKKYTNPYENIHSSCSSNGTISPPVCPLKPLSRSFFKMIEILNSFNIIEKLGSKKINSFHLAEGPGGFIEALALLRKNEEDNYTGMTLINSSPTVPGWKKTKNFLEKNPNVFLEYGIDGKGDIMNVNNLVECARKYGNSMDLITADGGFDFSVDFNSQEMLVQGLVACQVAFASVLQKKGGWFILKMFDLFSQTSLDILYLLASLYENIFIIKPNTSRYANSERYIVCQNFKLDDGRPWAFQWIPFYNNFSEKTLSRLLDITLPIHFINKVEESNTILGQQQIENISLTLNLIKNPRIEKIEALRRNNIQKCIQWCQKYNLPFNRDIRQMNIFLSAKSKNSQTDTSNNLIENLNNEKEIDFYEDYEDY